MQAGALSLTIVLLDQVSKLLILRHFVLGESRPVIPSLLNFTYLRNTGAVWGTLQHQNEWLVLFSLAALAGIGLGYRWLVDDRRVHRLAIGCLVGGIVGNLIDRIKLGWVTDFLDVYAGTLHWPCFNVADAAICAGIGLYVVSAFLLKEPARNGPAADEGRSG